jgi:hypothetical protein
MANVLSVSGRDCWTLPNARLIGTLDDFTARHSTADWLKGGPALGIMPPSIWLPKFLDGGSRQLSKKISEAEIGGVVSWF